MSHDAADCVSNDRRRFVARLAAAGALGAGGLSGFMSRALAKGDLPPGINQLKGTATVNGRAATIGTPVTPRDRIATGPGSTAVVVVGDDAFLVRENTTFEFAETGGVLSRVLIQSGRVLSVFGKKPVVIKARTATIGIRGTGAYLEVDPDKVYFCLCYGEADLDGPGSTAVVVVADDAFLVRENTTFEFAETGGVLSRVLIQSGRVLSVFGKKPVVIKARTATIGIRGTGAYLEVDPDKVYFCLCYGEADLDGPGMSAPKRIKTTHHESPLVITDKGGAMAAVPGPVMNHTDDELMLLESLVGREPPFSTFPSGNRY